MSKGATAGSATGRGRVQSGRRSQRAHPVPGTVEIESYCEVDTSAAVPGTDMEIGMQWWQPAGGSGCGRGRVRRPCPILCAGSEALRPPAGDGWSPRPPAASNLGKRHGEMGATKSRESFHTRSRRQARRSERARRIGAIVAQPSRLQFRPQSNARLQAGRLHHNMARGTRTR